MSVDISPEVIDQLDDILAATPCDLLIEDIGDLLFGGLLVRPRLDAYFDDVVEAGTALRRHEALPLAAPVPPEIGFFLISWAVERLQDAMIREGARGIDRVARRLEEIERRRGVGGRLLPWAEQEAPSNWQAANREWERIADEIYFDALEPYAPDMAALFRDDLEEFDRRREVGRQNFARLVGRDDVLQPLEEVIAEILAEEEEA